MRIRALFLLVAGLIFLAPFQAKADLSYTMTNYQSMGPLYASGEIIGTLTGDLNISPLYSFCVDNTALLYENQPYTATLTTIGTNQGLLESAYLIATYVPTNTALTNTNQGVALQWAMWMALGQGSPLTDTSVQNPTLAAEYGTIYSQAQSYLSQAQAQYLAGNLSQYAGYQELQLADSQDLLLVPTATPVPPSIILFGSGLMSLVAAGRRFIYH